MLPSPTSTGTRTGSLTDSLARKRPRTFSPTGLPSHLHVTGVGPTQYVDAGHMPATYLGSAKVSLQSDHAGESIGGDYDVYDSPAAAAAAFAQADSNFSGTPQAGATTREQLSPSVGAFCGQQAPPNAFTCWFVRGPTTGLVDATIPASADGGDTHALLQALLNHLIAVGG